MTGGRIPGPQVSPIQPWLVATRDVIWKSTASQCATDSKTGTDTEL